VFILSNTRTLDRNTLSHLRSNCENCFGLCCVALPYSKSADFAFNKDSGTPCRNLQTNYICVIHKDLRGKGFRGCSAYECFGAGQKVSQVTYNGKDWLTNKEIAQEMFNVYPIMQQLHEMLWYLNEAITLEAAKPIVKELQVSIKEIEVLTNQKPENILTIGISEHRANVNELLIRSSELVRNNRAKKQHDNNGRRDYFGAKLKGADLKGENLRGALFIAADLRNADMRFCDVIGADFRDADISGADLTGSIFLTQAQVNAAKGNKKTKLPNTLIMPSHWNL
jgi:uncharacterized protein YjbI with pentapeptide repeats